MICQPSPAFRLWRFATAMRVLYTVQGAAGLSLFSRTRCSEFPALGARFAARRIATKRKGSQQSSSYPFSSLLRSPPTPKFPTRTEPMSSIPKKKIAPLVVSILLPLGSSSGILAPRPRTRVSKVERKRLAFGQATHATRIQTQTHLGSKCCCRCQHFRLMSS